MKSCPFTTFFISLICFSCGSSSSSNSETGMQNLHAMRHQQMHNELKQKDVQSGLSDVPVTGAADEHEGIFDADDPKTPLFRQKWKEGVVFYAEGKEPGWSLSIYQSGFMRFQTTDGLYFSAHDVTPLPCIDPKIIDYRAVSEKGEMIIQMVEKACGDEISGDTSDYSLDISLKLKGKNDKTILNGCGDFIPDTQLSGNWVINNIDSLKIDPDSFNIKQPVLSIDLYKQTFSGNDGCNSFHGPVKFKLNKIMFGQAARTLTACPDMEISEKIINSFMGKSMTYKISDGLILYNGDGESMVLKRAE